MHDTYSFTDFDEQYVVNETETMRLSKANTPDGNDSVLIKQFDADADWFDRDRFQTVLDRWTQLGETSPYVRRIVDAGLVAKPWLAVETMPGGTASSKYLFEDVVVTLTATTADALASAHSLGIYHNHLSPSAINFRDPDDPMSLAIGDWETAVINPPQPQTATRWNDQDETYLAPEQTAKTDSTLTESDARVGDVYQLGMTAYAMLSFSHPDPSPTADDIREAIPVNFPDRDEFADAIVTAISEDPNDRFQSMAEFSSALRDIRVRV